MVFPDLDMVGIEVSMTEEDDASLDEDASTSTLGSDP